MPRKKKELPNRSDGLYEIKVTVGKNIDGSPIRKSFYSSISKEDARKQAENFKIEREVANRTGQGFIDKDITFADWAVKWMETYKKPDVSENSYRNIYTNTINNHLIPYFQKSCLQDIRPIDIKNLYIAKQSLSKTMLNNIRLCLNGIFEAGIDNDLCFKNPCRGISFTSLAEKHKKEVYTDTEIQIVEELAEKTMPEIIILLETGLRCGEMLGLTWEDIDFQEETISVKRSIAYQRGVFHGVAHPPKKGSYRTNPLSQKAIQTLYACKHRGIYIFPNKEGNPYSPMAWSRKLSTFMKHLPPHLPRLTAHELRHTYGTYLRRHGVDIYTIQKIMGHKDIKMTTEIYVHNEIESLKSGLQIINGGKSLKENLS